MKKTPVILLVVFAVVASLGSAVMAVVIHSGNTARNEAILELQNETTMRAERLAELESANTALSAQIKKLRTAPKSNAQLPDNIEAIISEQVDAKVVSLVDHKMVGLLDIVANMFNEQVAAIESREQTQRDERREQQRDRAREWQRRSRESQVDRMVETLGLDDYQREQVGEIVAASGENLRDAMAQMREEGNFNFPAIAENVRDQNDDAMREVLTEEQFVTYKEQQEQEYGWLFNMMGVRRGRGNQPTGM